MRPGKILILSIPGLLLAACTATNSQSPSVVAISPEAIPTPASALIQRFVWQTDGLCGYRVLRPEMWTTSKSECRAYVLPGSQSQMYRLTLRVANYQVIAQQQTGGILAQYELFKQNPSLEGWTKGVERMWQNIGIESTLEDTLSRAKIYSLRSPDSSDLQLLALIADQKQPLVLSLNASGEYANLERLRNDHLWEDFVTMVNSLGAISYEPGNVIPSLPER